MQFLNNQRQNNAFFIGKIGKGRGGSLLYELDNSLLQVINKVDGLKKRQSHFNKYKDIKGKWSLSSFFPFSSGDGKPHFVKNLVGNTVLKNRNKVVVGEMGKGYSFVDKTMLSLEKSMIED